MRSAGEVSANEAKALRAAVTAMSTSAALPAATDPIISSVAGLVTAMEGKHPAGVRQQPST